MLDAFIAMWYMCEIVLSTRPNLVICTYPMFFLYVFFSFSTYLFSFWYQSPFLYFPLPLLQFHRPALPSVLPHFSYPFNSLQFLGQCPTPFLSYGLSVERLRGRMSEDDQVGAGEWRRMVEDEMEDEENKYVYESKQLGRRKLGKKHLLPIPFLLTRHFPSLSLSCSKSLLVFVWLFVCLSVCLCVRVFVRARVYLPISFCLFAWLSLTHSLSHPSLSLLPSPSSLPLPPPFQNKPPE